jgi:site-specific DNA-methyltransferase (adenine-specific)
MPNILAVHPTDNNNHPTEKPVALVSTFIGLITQPGEIVLDPFMGSGTTLLAAKLEGRRAIGIEIEEKYCEIAANRLRQKVLF